MTLVIFGEAEVREGALVERSTVIPEILAGLTPPHRSGDKVAASQRSQAPHIGHTTEPAFVARTAEGVLGRDQQLDNARIITGRNGLQRSRDNQRRPRMPTEVDLLQ